MNEDTIIDEENDSEDVKMIKELINTRIRPFVLEDGGNITYVDFVEQAGVVYVDMKGACATCPSVNTTLKGGVEKMLVHYVDSVKTVELLDFDFDAEYENVTIDEPPSSVNR